MAWSQLSGTDRSCNERWREQLIELFEHNQIAYDALCTMLQETGKAAIVHPTGPGKSLADVIEVKPNFIILDQFHRCSAEKWGKGVQKQLAMYPTVALREHRYALGKRYTNGMKA